MLNLQHRSSSFDDAQHKTHASAVLQKDPILGDILMSRVSHRFVLTESSVRTGQYLPGHRGQEIRSFLTKLSPTGHDTGRLWINLKNYNAFASARGWPLVPTDSASASELLTHAEAHVLARLRRRGAAH